MTPGIYQGDCLNLIPQIETQIDVCITDPPYGIDYQSNRKLNKMEKIRNDDQPFTDWVQPMFDAMSDGGRLVTFYRWDVQEQFVDALEAAGFTIKSQLVWHKLRYGMGDLTAGFSAAHELMLYATKGRYQWKRKRPLSVYPVKRVHENAMIHPNQKPDKLIKQIARDISLPGDVSCDPFGGSFSTYRALTAIDRPCYSFELDPGYYEIGRSATYAAGSGQRDGVQSTLKLS